MLKRLTLAAMLSLGVAAGALAAGERHGGTLVFTAPYGSSFATLDVQSSPNTQEEFITQAIHRALYSWDSNQSWNWRHRRRFPRTARSTPITCVKTPCSTTASR